MEKSSRNKCNLRTLKNPHVTDFASANVISALFFPYVRMSSLTASTRQEAQDALNMKTQLARYHRPRDPGNGRTDRPDRHPI